MPHLAGLRIWWRIEAALHWHRTLRLPPPQVLQPMLWTGAYKAPEVGLLKKARVEQKILFKSTICLRRSGHGWGLLTGVVAADRPSISAGVWQCKGECLQRPLLRRARAVKGCAPSQCAPDDAPAVQAVLLHFPAHPAKHVPQVRDGATKATATDLC